ncbi:MAG: YggU family protein [Nitrospirae bacterium CG_4_9_14_3_um_filter_51_5]|nr:MAG: YggU family protein [Nitrospirae bacterium CG_4_9_14_3_um_filter_51_5]
MELAKCVIERSVGVEIRIHLQPRASKTEIVGLHGEALKIRIASPPVDGQANAELCRYLARCLGVPQQSVQLISGVSSRQKRVFIPGKTLAEIGAVLTKSPSLKNPEHA